MNKFHYQGLSLQIIIGSLLGMIFAYFFKSSAATLAPVGRAFVMLLQMPVLIFMFCSIIVGIGGMTWRDGKSVFTYALVFLAGAFAITKVSIFIIPLAFPPIARIRKFASIQSDHTSDLGLINAFIPENPFKSFADGTVPAVVVFSIFFAIALLSVKNRGLLLKNFAIAQEASMVIVNWITKLSFFGVFALTASSMGSFNIFAIPELKYYYFAVIFGSIFVSVILLPLLITVFLPIHYFRLMAPLVPALLLALISGNVLITLPLVLNALQINMADCGYNDDKLKGLTSTLVPLTVNFPISGKLLNLLFIYFVSWRYQDDWRGSEELELSTVGLLTSFGSAEGGISYLLNSFKLPADAIALFIPSLEITSKFIAFSRVASIAALCFFTVSSFEHRLTFKLKTLIIALIIVAVGFGSWFALMSEFAQPIDEEPNLFLTLTIDHPVKSTVLKNTEQIPARELKSSSLLEDIRQSKVLRVGFNINTQPFAFFNNNNNLVGHDIELAHRLAADLGVSIIFVPFDFRELIPMLNSHKIDIAMSAITITNERLSHIDFSSPYAKSEHVLVTKDFNQKRYDSKTKIDDSSDVVIAVLKGSSFYEQAKLHFANKNIVQLKSYDDFITMGENSLLYWATPQATYWIIVHPEFGLIRLPRVLSSDDLAFALPWDARDFTHYINGWLEIEKSNGTLDKMYRKWILGEK